MAVDDPPTPSQPRPGSQTSAPSASHYLPELPYAEELQGLLEGRYVVENFLGQGGMGAVYRGLQLPLKRPVAIKILQKRQAGVEDEFAFEERFKREAYAMAALTHPHIVQVYDCGDAGDNFLFISMELVEGGDLSEALKGGQFTPERALKLIPQICAGLQAAHDRGIVHRDIKPANIFLTADGRAKVADFGLAKKFDVKSTFMTKTGLGMGTPDYAAPEQYESVADIDHRADIYSLGVMMYQMITGTLPRGTFKAPSHRVPVDPRVDAIVAKSMEPDRSERYQSVAEIAADIAKLKPPAATPSFAARDVAVPIAIPVVTAAVPTRTSPVPAPLRASLPTRPVMKPMHNAARQPQAAAPVPLPPKKSAIGMIVGVLGVVAVIAMGAFFAFKPKPPASTPSTAPGPAAAPETARQTIDLLALTDAVQDRIKAPSVNKNDWVREGSALTYTSDGKGGMIAAPVAFRCRDYEVELVAGLRAGNEYINMDLPLAKGRVLTLAFNAAGRKVLSTPSGKEWVTTAKLFRTVTVRVTRSKDGKTDRIVIKRKDSGESLDDWTGELEKLGRQSTAYPAFPDQPVAALYVGTSSYAVRAWRMRVFEGEAEMLRKPSAPAAAQGSGTFASATKSQPFINTLGMKFVPVPITGGPTDQQRVLFSVWETRVQDYDTFAKEKYLNHEKTSFAQEPTHPTVFVNWDDAQTFCSWLSERDRKMGRLSATQRYRLPTDHEWSCAAGIGDREDATKSPDMKNRKIANVYPWGEVWPPPNAAGNYHGEEATAKSAQSIITGYRDDFPATAPVGSFPAADSGIYDLGGNVRELCEDVFNTTLNTSVMRGGSWGVGDPASMPTSFRGNGNRASRATDLGFRCVLISGASN